MNERKKGEAVKTGTGIKAGSGRQGVHWEIRREGSGKRGMEAVMKYVTWHESRKNVQIIVELCHCIKEKEAEMSVAIVIGE